MSLYLENQDIKKKKKKSRIRWEPVHSNAAYIGT